MTKLTRFCGQLLILMVATLTSQSLWAEENQSKVDVWSSLIKPHHFEARSIQEGQTIIHLNAPHRAEDATVVPISVNAQIPQTSDRYIKTLYVFADNNPAPLAGTFHLTPAMGRADLSMRIRIDQYTQVRAVAEMNTGELFMDSKFVRASGGCSLPPPFLELQDARNRLGKMKFRTLMTDANANQLAQLQISHPNVNGLQLDQRTRSIIPADYVTEVKLSFNDEPIMTALTDISISQDPSFRFFFNPAEDGHITAEMQDSKGRKFTQRFAVKAVQ